MPNIFDSVNLCNIVVACGYEIVVIASDEKQMEQLLKAAKAGQKLTFVDIRCKIDPRKDLGCPTTTPKENKKH